MTRAADRSGDARSREELIRQFAANVTGYVGEIEELGPGIVTEALTHVYLETHLPDDHDADEVADGMRALVEAADLRIGRFLECARTGAERVTDELRGRGGLRRGEQVTYEELLAKVFNKDIEDVSDVLQESGPIVGENIDRLAESETGFEFGTDEDRDRNDEGVGGP